MTKIIRCVCDHKSQDKMYGRGNRVGNKMTGKLGYYRCTVCSKEVLAGVPAGVTAKPDKKKK